MPSTKATERHDKGTTGRNFCELHEPLPRETTGFTISEASDVLPNLSHSQTLLCLVLMALAPSSGNPSSLRETPDHHGRYRPFSKPPTPIVRLPFALETSRRHGAIYITLKIRPIPSFERTFHYPSVLLPLHFIFADTNPLVFHASCCTCFTTSRSFISMTFIEMLLTFEPYRLTMP